MKFQTLTIVCGTAACVAKCPFCIAKCTPKDGLTPEVNWAKFNQAQQLALKSGVTTAMITGKGEPTLYPDQITKYLALYLEGEFPVIELQTNGIEIGHTISKDILTQWHRYGLTTVVLSIAHWENSRNQEIYLPDNKRQYPDLTQTIDRLHEVGFSVRLNCILLKGYVDSVSSVRDLIGFAKDTKSEQLTLMPVNHPKSTKNEDVTNWVKEHKLSEFTIADIADTLEHEGFPLMDLAHGARVYDYDGQNVCLSNCLSHERYKDESVMRNLIFFPDGHLRYDWEHTGAILL